MVNTNLSMSSVVIGISILFFFIFTVGIAAAQISSKDFNVPIYIKTSAGIQKASSDDIRHILAHHNFEIQKRQEYALDEKCSIRAREGTLDIEGITFTDSELTFNIVLMDGGPAHGSYSVKSDGDWFSLKFENPEVIEINSERLVFSADGRWRLNREGLNRGTVIVTLDKINNKVTVKGSGQYDPQIKDMDVTFIEGCLGEGEEFYLIIDKGELKETRGEKEVDNLLKDNPELIDKYEGLELSSSPIIPEFGPIIGVLTIASAIGIFLFIRRK
jgi:hypothetical protein